MNELQEKTWHENENSIMKALMDNDQFPISISTLEDLTGLDDARLLRHLRDMKKHGLVKDNDKRWIIQKIASFVMDQSNKIPNQSYQPIAVVRLFSSNVVVFRAGGNHVNLRVIPSIHVGSTPPLYQENLAGVGMVCATICTNTAVPTVNVEARSIDDVIGRLDRIEVTGYSIGGDFATYAKARTWSA
jgi:hypothetical protein